MTILSSARGFCGTLPTDQSPEAQINSLNEDKKLQVLKEGSANSAAISSIYTSLIAGDVVKLRFNSTTDEGGSTAAYILAKAGVYKLYLDSRQDPFGAKKVEVLRATKVVIMYRDKAELKPFDIKIHATPMTGLELCFEADADLAHNIVAGLRCFR
jgi:hypothetical protein